LGIDAHVTKDFNLAGKAHIGILLEITSQPQLLCKGERVGIG
jgi:hypothetical protein